MTINYFQHPILYIDKLAHFLTPQENTVLAKATREILGWQEQDYQMGQTRIALSVFVEGKFKRGMPKTEENRLCYGCGLGREAVIRALASLDEFGVLVKTGSGNDPNGQQYTLQFDPDQIDWDGLERRKAGIKRAVKKRISQARIARGG